MFTGIIESLGEVVTIEEQQGGVIRLGIRSNVSDELKVDQSVAHDGVCLTVVEQGNGIHYLQLVPETITRSRFSEIKLGEHLNIERAMRANARLDGHFVQGHVDATGVMRDRDEQEYFTFSYPAEYRGLLVDKGSVCINGVSLTVAGLTDETFKVALIPYTLEHTNLGELKPGSSVNLEFDILGKYVVRNIAHLAGTSGA